MKKHIAVIYRVQPSFINRRVALAHNKDAVIRFLQEHSGENFEIDLLEPVNLPGHCYTVVKSYTAQEFQAAPPSFRGADIIYRAYVAVPYFPTYTGTFDSMKDLHYWMEKNVYYDEYSIKELHPNPRGFYQEVETHYKKENGLMYTARFNTFAQNK